MRLDCQRASSMAAILCRHIWPSYTNMRVETMAGCGKMLLGSDSHTRYGMLGTLGIGEGGPELVKAAAGAHI